MAKFCSNCGKELDEKADICLNCGVLINKEVNRNNSSNVNNGKKKGLPTWAIVLIIVGSIILIPIIILILISIFVFNVVREEGSDYIEDARDYFNEYVEDYDITADGTIGDTLEIDGIKITLNSAIKYESIGSNIPKEGNEYLVFFFNVENASSGDKYITYLNFSGLVDNEMIIPKYFFNEIEGISNLNKELEYGETTTGYVAFEINKDWDSFDLNYRKLISGKAVTFHVVNTGNNSNLEV